MNKVKDEIYDNLGYKIKEDKLEQCIRCGWCGVAVMKDRYKYCVRWYCGKCGKWIR